MKSSRITLWVFILLLGSASPVLGSSSGKITSFSADWVMISADGKSTGTSKLYVTPEAYRMDGMPWGGGEDMPKADITILAHNDKNRQYIYNHDKKLVYESELDEQEMMDLMKSYQKVDSEEVLGKEKVSGYPCTKKKVTTTMDMMGMKITHTQTIWQSDRFEMPLRVRDDDGNVSELRNIEAKKPSAKFFRPLTGYARSDNMMAVIGMDFSGMEMDSDAGEQPGKEIPDVDPAEMVAAMERILGGEGADPEKTSQMREVLSHALEQARRMSMEAGASEGMWKVIPGRPGDSIGSELKTSNIYAATLGTQSSFEEVCRYYESRLTSEGWQNGGGHIQDGVGFLVMTRGEQHLTISSADDPGMAGTFKRFYSLKLRD